MHRVVMLLSNAFRPDPRVHKEACSLTQAGHKVTVLCWDRQGEFPAHQVVDGFAVRRLVVRSTYGAGSRQALYLPRFWSRALRELRALQPDIVHCHDLDTAPIGYLFARLQRVPWILDAHECYPEQMAAQVHRPIYYLLRWLERYLTRRATHVITVGDLLAQYLRALGGHVSVVGNYQPLEPPVPQPAITRVALGFRPEEFIVAYIGGFTLDRAILPLIRATEYGPDVTVLLLGSGPQQPAIEALLPTHPRVRYLGHVPQETVPAYTALADVIYYGLEAGHGNSQYSVPNALFNAMAVGRPVLTTAIGEIAHIVCQEQCGVVVDAAVPELLAAALSRLRDPAVRALLGANARRAAETRYNWSAAEAVLLQVYAHLAAGR